ncbi:MAG: hypothetical protein ACXU9U_04385 [Parachlamydiaceae bacterium]
MTSNNYEINSQINKLTQQQYLSEKDQIGKDIRDLCAASIASTAMSAIALTVATAAIFASAPIAVPITLGVTGTLFGIVAIVSYVAGKLVERKADTISNKVAKIEKTAENGKTIEEIFASEKEKLLTTVNYTANPEALEKLKVQYAQLLDDELDHFETQLFEANQANNQEKINYYQPRVEDHPRNNADVYLEKRRLESPTQTQLA